MGKIISVSFNRGAALYMGTPEQETDKAVKLQLQCHAAGVDRVGSPAGFAWVPKSVLVERFEGLYEVKKSFEDRIQIMRRGGAPKQDP